MEIGKKKCEKCFFLGCEEEVKVLRVIYRVTVRGVRKAQEASLSLPHHFIHLLYVPYDSKILYDVNDMVRAALSHTVRQEYVWLI